MIDRKKTIELIATHKVPKVTVAKLSQTYPQDVSAFVNNNHLTEDREVRIVNAVAELVLFITSLPFPPDLKDSDRLRDALGAYRVEHLREVGSKQMLAEYDAAGVSVQSVQSSGE
jgi:hypothetical protein